MTHHAVSLRQVYRDVLRRHPVLLGLLVGLQLIVPLVMPSVWTESWPRHYLMFLSHLVQIVVLAISVGIYAVLGTNIRLASAVPLSSMAIRLSLMSILLYLMARVLPLALSSIAGFSLLLSPTGVLILDHTQLGAGLFLLGIDPLLNPPIRVATYALLMLLVTCTALFRCRLMDCFSVAIAGLVRSGTAWGTLGILAILQAVALYVQATIWPETSALLDTTQLSLLCLLYGALVVPELFLVLFLMQHFWQAFAGTPSEPPPILDPFYEPERDA